MLRKTKVIGGTMLVVAAAVGITVPAAAASPAPAAASTTARPSKVAATHPGKSRPGLGGVGLRPAVIAHAAGTDVTGLKAGHAAGKSLTQIAAAHDVSRPILLSRLSAAADTNVAALIDTRLPARPAARAGKTCRARAPRAGDRLRQARGLRWLIRGNAKNLSATLDVTSTVLRSDLKKGQTLQQIAAAHKVTTATLLTVVEKDISTKLGKAIDRAPRSASIKATTPT